MEKKEDNDDNSCKVVIVGESGVGKTCIMIRFVQNRFDKNQLSSIGASYVDKTIKLKINDKQEPIQFMIWDTTGQEKYRALTRNFYTDAKVAILVYDSTCRDSFDKIKEFWFKEIIDNCPKDIIVALAANKIDEYMKEEVSQEEGQNFAEDNNIIFGCTSALSGSGVYELFADVGLKYLKSIVDKRKEMEKENNDKKNEQNQKQVDNKIKLNNSKHKKKKKKKKGKDCC